MDALSPDLVVLIANKLDITSAVRFTTTNKYTLDVLNDTYVNVKTLLRSIEPPKHALSDASPDETFHYALSLRTTSQMEHWARRALLSSSVPFYNAVRRSIARELRLQRVEPEATSFHLTAEQKRLCRHLPNTNTTVAVQAFAGTGKTSMMIEYARRNPDTSILYIAYNQALAKESSKRFEGLPHVRVSTMHAFALNHFQKDSFALGELDVAAVQSTIPETTVDVAFEIMQAFSRYCALHESERTDPRVDVIWTAMFDTKTLSVSHDAYLKAYQLLNIRTVDFGAILVDEVQDFTNCMLDILCNFGKCTKCFVGDIHQKIYGFKNVQEPYRYLMEHENTKNLKKYSLTRTFRFGHDLAMTVNNFLNYKFRAPGFRSHSPRNTTLLSFTSYDAVPDNSVVIARYNVTIFEVMFHLSNDRKQFHVKGDPLDLHAEIEHLGQLENFESSSKFSTVDDFIEHVYAIRDAKWMLRVALFSKYGTDIINLLKIATHYITEDDGIGIVTAHKSKGLEFENVVIAEDFGINSPDECNVLYVAITRAKGSITLPRVFLNYMFQKHPKLHFPQEIKLSVCSTCKRRNRFHSTYVEDDPEVILNNTCELYRLQTICDRCK